MFRSPRRWTSVPSMPFYMGVENAREKMALVIGTATCAQERRVDTMRPAVAGTVEVGLLGPVAGLVVVGDVDELEDLIADLAR